MGINKYQYSGSSNTCMLCNEPDECSNCDEARTLPWTNDIPLEIFQEFDMENWDSPLSHSRSKVQLKSIGSMHPDNLKRTEVLMREL